MGAKQNPKHVQQILLAKALLLFRGPLRNKAEVEASQDRQHCYAIFDHRLPSTPAPNRCTFWQSQLKQLRETAVMRPIFISYRRNDAEGGAGRLVYYRRGWEFEYGCNARSRAGHWRSNN